MLESWMFETTEGIVIFSVLCILILMCVIGMFLCHKWHKQADLQQITKEQLKKRVVNFLLLLAAMMIASICIALFFCYGLINGAIMSACVIALFFLYWQTKK